MTNKTESDVTAIKVLLADSRPIESQLLAGALLAQGFSVTPCETLADRILQGLETSSPDIIVFGLPLGNADVTVMRTVHLVASQIPKVLLLDCENRDIVVQAFRAGARGIFCLAESSFRALCECIEKVYRGEIWASNRQFSYLLDSVCQLPGLPVMSTTGEKLLTSREEQVVPWLRMGSATATSQPRWDSVNTP